MNDFITRMRNDRADEIKKKKDQGYDVDANSYRFVESILIDIGDGKKQIMGFQANGKDIFFYVIDNGANWYFSVVDLYKLLRYICISGHQDIVIDMLEKMRTTTIENLDGEDKGENGKNRGFFTYRGTEYYLKKIDYPEYNSDIETEDGVHSMTYQQLFVLINMIQEKSNAFFMRGEKDNTPYVNGLIRMLLCLIRGNKDHRILKSKGWIYNVEDDEYYLNKSVAEDKKFTYYLTDEEYSVIINKES